MNEDQIRGLLERHAASPEVSVREYAAGLIAELGNAIAGRRKLYLDTRYWIYLREAAMGRPRRGDHGQILDRVRALTSSGSILCPISEVAWMELSKQTDPSTHIATLNLIEELSLGVAIMGEEERVVSEIEQFISHPTLADATETLKDRVWTKAGYALGFAVPMVEGFSPEQNLVAQKATVDLCWQMSIRDLAETARSLPPTSDPWEKSATKITADMRRHAHEIRSIKQAFDSEIAGALSVFRDQMRVLLLRRFRDKTGHGEPAGKDEVGRAADQMHVALANAFRFKPKVMAKQIPSLHAYAMCHAAVRMDKTRKFNGHDLLDIHHASSGIPYHDAVFTENPLRVLVTAGNVALDKTYACQVLSKEEDVLHYLARLATEAARVH